MVKPIRGCNWRKVETLAESLNAQIARDSCEVMLKRPEFCRVAGKADGHISFAVSTRPSLSPFPFCFRRTRGGRVERHLITISRGVRWTRIVEIAESCLRLHHR